MLDVELLVSKTYSSTVESAITNNQIEVAYNINRGTETITINDEMLTTVEATLERAKSIFLEQSYTHKIVSFETYYISNFDIGTIIEVDSLLYCVIGCTYTINGARATMKVIAKRWE